MRNDFIRKGEFQVFIVSFVLLFLEIAFFHILSFTHYYLDAVMVISYALLGVGIGSVVAYFIRKGDMIFYSLLLLLIASIILAFLNIVKFPTTVFLSPFIILPFLLGSIVIAFFISRRDSNRIYFFNLIGGVLGVFSSVILIPLIKTENALIACMAFLSLVGLFYRPKNSRKVLMTTFSVILVVSSGLLVFNLIYDEIELSKITSCYQKGYSYYNFPKVFCSEKIPNHNYIFSRDNLVSRVTLYNATGDFEIVKVAFNGQFDDAIRPRPYVSHENDGRIPFMYGDNETDYRLFKTDPNILIIGTSSAGIVKPLKHLVGNNASLIKGVEINPAVVSIMKNEFFEYSERAYENLSVDVMDGRTFLKINKEKFNLITLMNTYKTGDISLIGEPDYLHTTDAINDYFDHLENEGFILLEEKIYNARSKFGIFRLLNNFYKVLEERGYENPGNHFFIYRWDPLVIIVIKKTPINNEEIEFFNKWVDYESSVWPSPMSVFDINYMPFLSLDTDYERFLISGDKETFFGENVIMEPNTDDKPYLFDVYKSHDEIAQMFIKVFYVCIVLFLLLSIFSIARRPRKISVPKMLSYIIYFSLIGLAYLVIEIVLMQRYQIYTGSPTNSLIFVLGALLLSSGLGAYFSRNYKKRSIIISFIAIILLSMYHLFINKTLLDLIAYSPISNSFFVLLSVLPLGFFMGVPFPYGLNLIKRDASQKHAAVMFGIGSIFSALASPFALLISAYHGFTITLAVGIICYLLALIIVLTNSKK